MITDSKSFEVGKTFSSAEEVLPYINQLSGIVIIDIKLPEMNGADLVWHITQSNKNVQCIICSMYDDDAYIFSALKNGALGYLLKDSLGDEILSALDELKNGGSPMSPYIARRVIASFQQQEKKVSKLLTDREEEVLQNVAQGFIYKEIAERLYISHETVKKHIKHIYQKLHVQNRIEALNKFRSS